MSKVSLEDLKDETADKPLDTHNINNALHTILKENGIGEIKRVRIEMPEKVGKVKGRGDVIIFEDQIGRIIEMEVRIPCKVHQPCCCSCK